MEILLLFIHYFIDTIYIIPSTMNLISIVLTYIFQSGIAAALVEPPAVHTVKHQPDVPGISERRTGKPVIKLTCSFISTMFKIVQEVSIGSKQISCHCC